MRQELKNLKLAVDRDKGKKKKKGKKGSKKVNKMAAPSVRQTACCLRTNDIYSLFSCFLVPFSALFTVD